MLLALLSLPVFALPHHDLKVHLDPAGRRIEVVDAITAGAGVVPTDDGAWRFVLHAGLEPRVLTKGWRLERVEGELSPDFLGINASADNLGDGVPLEAWRLVPKRKKIHVPVEIAYGGVIHHPVEQSGEEYQRSFEQTPGIIDEQGVFLGGSSYWLPTFGDGLVTFGLQVEGLDALPAATGAWDVVSQGSRTIHAAGTTRWDSTDPVDEVYLVAGPWVAYEDTVTGEAGDVAIYAFLRQDDAGLAYRYTQATRRYLRLYEDMLPPYPYRSFALVENFWDTGYGMPGFTLLGPQVIRFPWVLTSSYPHELLHNWWGNSVYVDYAKGNWCEGLTAYLADHLFAEDRGEDVIYRRSTLKKYTDFVRADKDFPLVAFGSRSSAASEAVGYGKTMMLFHMVRRALDEQTFLAALDLFYTVNQYTRVGFDEVAQALTDETGVDWYPWFRAWTTRTGAPLVALEGVEVEGTGPWSVSVRLRQAQEEDPFPVTIPLALTVEGGPPVLAELGVLGRQGQLTIETDKRPLRLDVDPAFDVMRRLDPLEVPPAISTLMGAETKAFVLPAAAGEAETAAWKALALHWARPGTPEFLVDSEIAALPEGNVWVLGWGNRFATRVTDALSDAEPVKGGLKILADTFPQQDHSVVLVARATDPDLAVGWVAGPPAAIPGLARKLPHYTKYSYLAFKGDAPDNVLKGMWEPTDSPLVRDLTDQGLAPLALPERPRLAELPGLFDGELIGRTAAWLADPARGGRGVGAPGLAQATDYVEKAVAEAGLVPVGDGFRQSFTGKGPDGEATLTNLVAKVPGKDPSLPPVVVLAHLDHLGTGWPDVRSGNEGEVHPGADDNASGVAVALEVARALAAEPPRARDVIFAFTTGEESGLQGARHLVQGLGGAMACLALDTVGRLGDGQLLVLDAASAYEWRFIFMGVGYTTGVPVTIPTEPLDSSDQAACLEAGIPAVQLFTGPHEDYHRPGDTADKLDRKGMAEVAEAAREAVVYLAERAEPLQAQATGSPGPQGGERKVSLGTMPDFAFPGPGVRVDKVMPGTGAEAAGIRPGDVVIAIDGETIAGLREYSAVLKRHAAGDLLSVTLRRGDQTVVVKARLSER